MMNDIDDTIDDIKSELSSVYRPFLKVLVSFSLPDPYLLCKIPEDIVLQEE